MVIYIITGTPAVGKHTVSKIVAEMLRLKIVDVNEIAFTNDAIIEKKDDTSIVDLRKLKKAIKKELENDVLIVGHLAPYLLSKNEPDLVIVLRRSPYELEEIYTERRYGEKKSRDNLGSEILGILLYDSVKRFGKEKIIEIDVTGKRPEAVAEEIVSTIKKGVRGIVGTIDWLDLVMKRDDIQRFFKD